MRDRTAVRRFALIFAGIGFVCAASAAEPNPGEVELAAKITACASCHGADGNSTREGIPSLAGQPETLLVNQLILIREGVRRSELMRPLVRGFDDATIVAIAKHFAALPPRSLDGPADPALVERGRELAKAGHCGSCHLPDFSGRAQIPRLAGQREDYLVATLTGYRNDVRTRPDTTMNDIMRGAPDEDIRALAHFLARLAPRTR